ncbi:9750_t:CDS:1, partial [Funneliformis geosporum]
LLNIYPFIFIGTALSPDGTNIHNGSSSTLHTLHNDSKRRFVLHYVPTSSVSLSPMYILDHLKKS